MTCALVLLGIGMLLGATFSGLYFTSKIEALEEDLNNHVYAAHQLAWKLGLARQENEHLTTQTENLIEETEH